MPGGAFRLTVRENGGDSVSETVTDVPDSWRDLAEAALSEPPPVLPGLPRHRPLVMGVINVTPDSFSDGGERFRAEAAIEAGRAMLAAGADLLDVGGESTRPGADPVPPEEEIARIVPVIEALSPLAPVSVDTRNAATMQAALAAGAVMVNDVSALSHDPRSAAVVAEAGCAVVLMHMRGTPTSMSSLTDYVDVALDVHDELAARLSAALRAGVARERIVLDPGIGFAKTVAQNLILLRRLALFRSFGRPLLVGVSRKSFIGWIADEPEPKRRLAGSLAAGLLAAINGASILRVHDVAETVQALKVWRAIGTA